MERIIEKYKCECEGLLVSSNADSTSRRYDMSQSFQAACVISIGHPATLWPGGTQPVASLMQAGDNTAAAGAITGTSAVFGSTAANRVDKALIAIITLGSATTSGNTVTINGIACSYTGSTADNATAYEFGSTIGSTAEGGLDASIAALTSVINTYCPGCTATTISTVACEVRLEDNVATSINIAASASSPIVPQYRMQQACINITADQLDSTSRYISASFTTMSTSKQASICWIRDNRFAPTSTSHYGAFRIAT